MKKLFLIRHAKSSWKNLDLDDFDRPLNKRGRFDAPLMADILYFNTEKVDAIISSPAIRAKSTAQIIADRFNTNIFFKDEIYHASTLVLQTLIKNFNTNLDTIFLVGHNPGLNFFADEFVNLYTNIPTCGVVAIGFDCDSWKNISKECSKLLFFEYPKKFKC